MRPEQSVVFAEDNSERSPTDLGEIEIFATQSVTDSDFCIGLHVRFDAARLSADDWSCSVTAVLERAYVQLVTEDCSISREGRVGAGNRPLTRMHDVETTTSRAAERMSSTSTEGQVGITVGDALATLSGSARGGKGKQLKSSAVVTNVSRSQEMIEAFTVLTNERWQVKDVFANQLLGQYAPEDHFCKVVMNDASGSVRALLQFYPKDLKLDHEESTGFSISLLKSKPTNVAVARALVAKHLRMLNATKQTQPSDGRINLAASVVHFEVRQDGNY